MCLGLETLLANTIGWYDDCVNITGEIINGKYRSRGDFFKYTHKYKRVAVAENSIEFIYHDLKPYEEKKLVKE